MNKNDIRIITQLRQNARMPLTTMSRQTNIPTSTLFDRIKQNLNNLIVRHTSLVDFYKLGYSTRANILIKVNKEDKQKLKEFLKKELSINSVFRINSGFDFIIEGIFREMKDMDEFVERLETRFNILETKTYYIIEDLKREAFMSDPEMIVS